MMVRDGLSEKVASELGDERQQSTMNDFETEWFRGI